MSEPTPDHRTIDVAVEVVGTPEEVWQAIATGPGIAAWFVPAVVDGHEGGKLTLTFGEMGEETAVLTAWEPPHRWEATWGEWGSPTGSALELLVEARARGSCVVRLVHSGFGPGAEWDDEFDQTTAGWAGFLHNLKLYLERFAPQPCVSIFANGGSESAQPTARAALVDGLGLSELAEGQRVATSDEAAAAGAPRLAGMVDRLIGGTATLVIDEPGDGFAVIAAEGPDGRVFMNVSAYLFGAGAASIAEQEAPRWRAWMARHFPHARPET